MEEKEGGIFCSYELERFKIMKMIIWRIWDFNFGGENKGEEK